MSHEFSTDCDLWMRVALQLQNLDFSRDSLDRQMDECKGILKKGNIDFLSVHYTRTLTTSMPKQYPINEALKIPEREDLLDGRGW